MGFLSFFSGGTPEKYEQKADAFVIRKVYGQAKAEYEKALARLERQTDAKPEYRALIEDKLRHCQEELALEHRQNGDTLAEAGCHADAAELFHLALELTADPELAADLQDRLDRVSAAADQPGDWALPDDLRSGNTLDEAPAAGSEEEYFAALLNSLDDDEREAYRSYPEAFKRGFIALNQGDFKAAVALLTDARDADPQAVNHITLELATAHLNLGESDTARELLAVFLKAYPESLKAYYLMCESLWEANAFDAAEKLLSHCPAHLSQTLPFQMLAGETLLRSERYGAAVSFFRKLLETGPWDKTVAQALARAYEALDRPEKARALYAEIMNSCAGCNARVDPAVKLRYAETSFATGDFSTKILELYLDLAREDAANRQDFFRKISHIYEQQGNVGESRRFAAFAQQLAAEDGPPKEPA